METSWLKKRCVFIGDYGKEAGIYMVEFTLKIISKSAVEWLYCMSACFLSSVSTQLQTNLYFNELQVL
jgi:hypothetical protein